MRVALLSAVLLAALPLNSALAEGVAVYGGASISFASSGDPGAKTDVYGYLEADFANFYLGASADLYEANSYNEIALNAGYRNTIGSGLSYDLSYTRYIYPNDGGDCCGEVALSLSMPLNDVLTLTADASFYPEDDLTDTYLTLDYAMSDKITLTGSIGRIGNQGAADTKDFELAGTYALGEETAVTVHYYDGSDYDGYFGLDLTWDTTLFGG